MDPEDLKKLIGSMIDKHGSAFTALFAMLSRLSARDLFRMANLMRTTARQKLNEVETDIMRHVHYSRYDKASNLYQFRKLYARLYDLSSALGYAIDTLEKVEPEDLGKLLADGWMLVVSLVGVKMSIDVSDLPPSLSSGIPDTWAEPPPELREPPPEPPPEPGIT